tara:strand:+ start:459 stop:845 length:387 start_codon:yes stop_codon:yes gene_type:complete
MSIISKSENAIKFGNKILNENNFLHDLTSLMENEEFKNFFDKYMNNWVSVKSSIMYMKLYSEFKEKYKEVSDDVLDKNIIVYLLCKVMRNRSLMSFSVDTIDKMYNDERVNYFKELETFMENQKMLTL